MECYIKLMRVTHYLKNFLIFLPLIFSGNIFDKAKLLSCVFAFLAFSAASSVVYIINDIKDREKDRQHEVKKTRPIASGKVSVKQAVVIALFCVLVSYIFAALSIESFSHVSFLYIIIYVLLNIAYSFGLKNIPLLDLSILVSGFLLRVLYGASIIDVSVSNWLYLTVISAAFYLGLGKRRNEIKKSGAKSRKVLSYYNENFLDKNMYMCLTLTIIFYSLWCVDPVNVVKSGNLLIWTVPLVILIFMKYSMDVENDSYGDPVEVILSDKILFLMGIVYVTVIVLMIYAC